MFGPYTGIIYFGFVAIGLMVAVIWEMSRKVPNALIWRHPDNGGGLDLTTYKHEKSQRPYHCKYRFWGLVDIPIYLFYEVKQSKEVELADLPRVPISDNGNTQACICGFRSDNERTLKLHTLWTPKSGITREEYQQRHKLADAEYQKSAVSAIATAIQDQSVMQVTYAVMPYEPIPDVTKSPNALWDMTDWSAAMDYEAEQKGLTEHIKVGMGITMVIVLAIILFLIIGEVQKGGG